jgi:hypothetical protein
MDTFFYDLTRKLKMQLSTGRGRPQPSSGSSTSRILRRFSAPSLTRTVRVLLPTTLIWLLIWRLRCGCSLGCSRHWIACGWRGRSPKRGSRQTRGRASPPSSPPAGTAACPSTSTPSDDGNSERWANATRFGATPATSCGAASFSRPWRPWHGHVLVTASVKELTVRGV